MVSQFLASERVSGMEALHEARGMLAQEEPDAAGAVPLLIHALGSRNLLVRSAAAEILTLLGKVAVPGMIARWPDADAERRRALLVILGRMGPAARGAVPLLRLARADAYLGPAAAQALQQVQPINLAALAPLLRSPETWRRLPDIILALLTHPGMALLSLACTAFSVATWWQTLADPQREIAPTVSASFALVGACVGATTGGKIWGCAGAQAGAKHCGAAGAAAGFFVGGLIGTLVEPLARVLGH